MRWIPAAALTMLCACGTSPIAFADWCNRYSSFECSAADHCGCLDSLTRSLCPSMMLQQCQDDVEKSVNAGTKTYDAAQAGQCLSDLNAVVSDCSLTGDSFPDSCNKMLVGALAAGETCASDSECQPGLSCLNNVCTVMPTDGHACLDSQCADKLFCGSDTLCHTARAQGGACLEGSYACADGLFCEPKTTTCQPYYGAGGDCSGASYACKDGFYCATANQVCTAYPGEGGSCSDTRADCADGLYCDDTHVCRNELDSGQPCTDDSQCKSDSCVGEKCSSGSCVFL